MPTYNNTSIIHLNKLYHEFTKQLQITLKNTCSCLMELLSFSKTKTIRFIFLCLKLRF